MITIETTEADARVTIPKSEVPSDRLQWFVDALRLEAIFGKSHLTENEASRLADEIKAGWWGNRFCLPAGRRVIRSPLKAAQAALRIDAA